MSVGWPFGMATLEIASHLPEGVSPMIGWEETKVHWPLKRASWNVPAPLQEGSPLLIGEYLTETQFPKTHVARLGCPVYQLILERDGQVMDQGIKQEDVRNASICDGFTLGTWDIVTTLLRAFRLRLGAFRLVGRVGPFWKVTGNRTDHPVDRVIRTTLSLAQRFPAM